VLGVGVELGDGAMNVFAINGRGDDDPATKAPRGLRPLFAPRPRPRPAGDGVLGWLWPKLALFRTEKRAGVAGCARFGVYGGCPLLVLP
jgi:hypothetical protein